MGSEGMPIGYNKDKAEKRLSCGLYTYASGGRLRQASEYARFIASLLLYLHLQQRLDPHFRLILPTYLTGAGVVDDR